MSADSNAEMRAAIDRFVVGSKVLSLEVSGRTVTIEFEAQAHPMCIFTLTKVNSFELRTGRWVFVPNRDPGRPKKAGSKTVDSNPENPGGTKA